MPAPIKVILADDHEIFREGFAGMFHNHQDIEVVAMAPNGLFLVNLVSTHKPDVVLTDIQMPEMGGIEATRIIHQKFPGIPIIAISMFDDNYSIIDMLNAGAIGYLVKNATKAIVTEAIKAAFTGENYYCRTASQKLSALITTGRYNPKSQGSLDFTPTELRIIHLICEEKETKYIAAELHVSIKSMEKYRSEIMVKAGVESNIGLVMWAVRNGVVRV